MSNIYPTTISDRIRSLSKASTTVDSDSTGRSVAFECGTFVSFQLKIGTESKLIESITFRSNGCGFMLAAADVLASGFEGRLLTELHSLTEEPWTLLLDRLSVFPSEREHCAVTVIDALKDAFSELRRSRIEEFAGEKALVCTCFGVTEADVELNVKQGADTVELVGQKCRAGTGCGACQMMISEIIDAQKANI